MCKECGVEDYTTPEEVVRKMNKFSARLVLVVLTEPFVPFFDAWPLCKKTFKILDDGGFIIPRTDSREGLVEYKLNPVMME
jgi:hypothetical protein